MATVNLTANEKRFIEVYCNSEYLTDPDGWRTGEPVWTNCHIDNMQSEAKIDRHQSAGILSSLVKKGLMGSDRGNHPECCLWLTPAGVAIAETFVSFSITIAN